jgi:hypothetical protein
MRRQSGSLPKRHRRPAVARSRIAAHDQHVRAPARPGAAGGVRPLPAAINIRGETVPLDLDGPLSDAAWAKEKLARAKQTPPNGYC